MQTQRSTPGRWGFALAVFLIVASFALIVILPQFSPGSSHPWPGPLHDQLMAIRSQIESYNREHPTTPYNATTPVGPAFWDTLVQSGSLQAAPRNPLQDDSTLVVAEPRNGAGWVWTETWASWPVPPELAGAFNVYAIDENGNFYDWDEDGWPD